MPEAVRILQTRLTDSLLRPLEEVVRVELAPRFPNGHGAGGAPAEHHAEHYEERSNGEA